MPPIFARKTLSYSVKVEMFASTSILHFFYKIKNTWNTDVLLKIQEQSYLWNKKHTKFISRNFANIGHNFQSISTFYVISEVFKKKDKIEIAKEIVLFDHLPDTC